MNNSVTQRCLNVSLDVCNDFQTSLLLVFPSPSSWSSILDEETLSYIPAHWLEFPPPSYLHQAFLGALYAFLFMIGATTNGTIIFLYLTCRTLRTPSNNLVMNLAVSDFLMIAKMPLFVYNSVMMGPATGRTGCSIYGFVGGLTGTSAILTITAIALERFYVIRFPLKRKLSRKKSYFIITFIWCYSLLFSGMPLLEVYSRYVPEGYLTACSFDYLDDRTGSRIFILIFFGAAFVIPLTCIISSYIGIVCIIKNSSFSEGNKNSESRRIRVQRPKGISTSSSVNLNRSQQRRSFQQRTNSMSRSVSSRCFGKGNSPSNSRINSRSVLSVSTEKPMSSFERPVSTTTTSTSLEMKLTRIAFFLIISWTISWTPYAVVALLGISGNSDKLTPLSSMIPALFAKTASIVDPIIYGLSHPKFQKELRRLFFRRDILRRNDITLLATRAPQTSSPVNVTPEPNNLHPGEIQLSTIIVKKRNPVSTPQNGVSTSIE